MKNQNLFKLGLTGSIATGKSTILTMFEKLGYISFSADAIVHQLYQDEAVPLIEQICPDAIIGAKVDRAILAKFLLANPQEISQVEAQIHPLVLEKYAQFIQSAERSEQKMAIIDIPLLYESKNDYELDAIAVTFCTEETQRQRAMARHDMTQQKFEAILARQLSQDEKRRRADFEIDTNRTLGETKNQIVEIANQCLAIRKKNFDTEI